MRNRHAFASLCLAFASLAFAAAPARGQATKPADQVEIEYAAAFMGGSKIGYGVNTRSVSADRVVTNTEINISLARSSTPLTIRIIEMSVETPDGRPISFRSVQDMAVMAQTVEGKVDATTGKMRVTTTSAGEKTDKTMDWPKGALMSEGARRLQLAKGLKKGTTYKYDGFDTSSLIARPTAVTIGEKKNVDLLGRVVPLTEVQMAIHSADRSQAITGMVYVDDEGKELKSTMQMLGMELVVVACPKEVAMSPAQPVDFFSKLMLRSPAPLGDLSGGQAVKYILKPTDGRKVNIPATDTQTVATLKDGSIEVTVQPFTPAAGAAFPYTGKDARVLAALKPTRFVESNNAKVVELARQAVGDTKDAAEAVRRIQKFVREYISEKGLSVGYASAAEVAVSRQGDCTEHAVLAAAMCRAVGIPAEVVDGLAYVSEFMGQKNVFGPHAWAQVLVGGKWTPLDAALPNGFDAGHITLGCGDGGSDDFFSLVNSLGFFSIEKAEIFK